MENEECGNQECGKGGVWELRSVENEKKSLDINNRPEKIVSALSTANLKLLQNSIEKREIDNHKIDELYEFSKYEYDFPFPIAVISIRSVENEASGYRSVTCNGNTAEM